MPEQGRGLVVKCREYNGELIQTFNVAMIVTPNGWLDYRIAQRKLLEAAGWTVRQDAMQITAKREGVVRHYFLNSVPKW